MPNGGCTDRGRKAAPLRHLRSRKSSRPGRCFRLLGVSRDMPTCISCASLVEAEDILIKLGCLLQIVDLDRDVNDTRHVSAECSVSGALWQCLNLSEPHGTWIGCPANREWFLPQERGGQASTHGCCTRRGRSGHLSDRHHRHLFADFRKRRARRGDDAMR
jgi:hypothetical protein